MVLFSGGQDSTVCLGWALENFERVETVGFDYGQRHRVELDCRTQVLKDISKLAGKKESKWSSKLGEDRVLDLSVLGEISETALTRTSEIAFSDSGLPTTFVPGRNILFLTVASALGYRRGIFDLVGGMCETDYSGYPDCRAETLESMAQTLRLGLDAEFVIHTPLMHMTKGETWTLAHDLGGDALVDLILEETHSCYLGDRSVRHEWGYGCGTCPACALRAKGYAAYRSAF